MAGRAIASELFHAKTRAFLQVTIHTETHRELDFLVQSISRSHLAMTGGTRHSGRRMAMMVEKYVGLRRQRIDPLPGDLFLTIKVLLDFENLGAVGLHRRMTAHAQRDAGNDGLSVLLRPEVAEGAGQFLFNMLPMAEGNRLAGRTFLRAG